MNASQTKKLILVLLAAAIVVGGVLLFMALPTQESNISSVRPQSVPPAPEDKANFTDDLASLDDEDREALKELDKVRQEIRQLPLALPPLDEGDDKEE